VVLHFKALLPMAMLLLAVFAASAKNPTATLPVPLPFVQSADVPTATFAPPVVIEHPAPYPIATFESALVCCFRAYAPIPVLLTPVAFPMTRAPTAVLFASTPLCRYKVLYPIAVLASPDVVDLRAQAPRATFLVPVVKECNVH